MNRYHRQTLLPFVGVDGQSKLAAARVLLVGCGALGGVIAEQLCRGGVGFLRIVDRDIVEWTNLQRQVLFDESDARDGAPKAAAAAKRLRAINSSITVEPHVVDVHAGNIENLAGIVGEKIDLILDGTDNAETRYLINDVAVKHGIPWVYGACVGSEGRVMLIRPNTGPCLRCVFPNPPSSGELPTCDTVGVLGPAASIVASLQATAAMKWLIDPSHESHSKLLTIDAWTSRFREIDIGDRQADCRCCGQRHFDFLEHPVEMSAAQLCGRDAVQIRPAQSAVMDLKQLALRLASAGTVQQTEFLLRCQLQQESNVMLTVFRDGRTIVQGTRDLGRARSLVSKYVGS